MPIIKRIHKDNVSVLIWKIQEPINYFYTKVYHKLSEIELLEYDSFTNNNRQLEYLVSRYALHILTKSNVRTPIIKDEQKPTLKNSSLHISITHSKNYVAVSISDKKHAIDIENNNRITPAIIKAGTDKFYNKNFDTSLYSPIELWLLGESIIKYGYKLKDIETNIDNYNLSFSTYQIDQSIWLGIVSKHNRDL